MDKPKLIQHLRDVVDAEHVTDDDFNRRACADDFGIMPAHLPDLVVRPKTTEEVASIVKIANEFNVPMIPRGGSSAQEGVALLRTSGSFLLGHLFLDPIMKCSNLQR